MQQNISLEAQNITFAYKKKIPILKGVNLRLEPGKMTALIGNNGSGKTTFLRIIAGITHQNSGNIIFDGKKISPENAMEYKQSIGFMPELLQLYPEMTAVDVLKFFSRLKEFDLKNVDHILDQVGLTQHATKPVKALSKGLKQRLNLAQAILGNPRILIFDEPSNGFDVSGVKSFYRIVRNKAEEGAIIVVTTHLLTELTRHMHSIAVLKEGQIVKQGTIEDLAKTSTTEDRTIWIDLAEPVAETQFAPINENYKRMASIEGLLLHGVVKKQQIADLVSECKSRGFKINNVRIQTHMVEETIEEYLA